MIKQYLIPRSTSSTSASGSNLSTPEALISGAFPVCFSKFIAAFSSLSIEILQLSQLNMRSDNLRSDLIVPQFEHVLDEAYHLSANITFFRDLEHYDNLIDDRSYHAAGIVEKVFNTKETPSGKDLSVTYLNPFTCETVSAWRTYSEVELFEVAEYKWKNAHVFFNFLYSIQQEMWKK